MVQDTTYVVFENLVHWLCPKKEWDYQFETSRKGKRGYQFEMKRAIFFNVGLEFIEIHHMRNCYHDNPLYGGPFYQHCPGGIPSLQGAFTHMIIFNDLAFQSPRTCNLAYRFPLHNSYGSPAYQHCPSGSPFHSMAAPHIYQYSMA